MRKLEGILTVVGVAVILGLPIFLMFYDVITAPKTSTDSLIKISTCEANNRVTVVMPDENQEKEVIKVENYVQDYQVLDDENEVSISDFNQLNDGIEKLPIDQSDENDLLLENSNNVNINTMIQEKNEEIKDVQGNKENEMFEDILDIQIPLGIENVNLADLNQDILEVNVEEIYELPIPASEEIEIIFDSKLDVNDDKIVLDDESIPESIIPNPNNENDIITDSTDVIIDEFITQDVQIEPETFSDVMIDDTISESINTSKDEDEIDNQDDEKIEVIEDNDLPESLQCLEGYDIIDINEVYGDNGVYEITVMYDVLNEDGTVSAQAVTFVY